MAERLIVFTVFTTLVAFAAHFFFGSIIFASEQKRSNEVVLRDVYLNETHDLSGIVTVPSACHDVSVRSKDIDAKTTVIIFETWEEPYSSQPCAKEPTSRIARTMIFGPQNLQFRGILDDEWVPLRVVLVDK